MLGNCELDSTGNSIGQTVEVSEPGFKSCINSQENRMCAAKVAAGKVVEGQCLLAELTFETQFPENG